MPFLVAGLAPAVPVLLAGRVLQGAGAAVAGPAGLALLTAALLAVAGFWYGPGARAAWGSGGS